jgi:23S rRNA pseudouridine2605 synthase
MTKIRINKFLADSGIASRRKSEQFILEKRVTVNDRIITDLSFKVDPAKDVILLDGEKIRPKKNIYILLNKPKGYITTVADDRKRKTVLDLVKTKERIYPVGRLDYDTTGLLFLTNDGDFSQLLTHPANKVPREYEVKLDKPLHVKDKVSLLNGIKLDGKPGKFIKINFPHTNNNNFVRVFCEEGRNKFVKRMFRRLGYTVIELNRISFAEIKLDIPSGKFRYLTQQEVRQIVEKYTTES